MSSEENEEPRGGDTPFEALARCDAPQLFVNEAGELFIGSHEELPYIDDDDEPAPEDAAENRALLDELTAEFDRLVADGGFASLGIPSPRPNPPLPPAFRERPAPDEPWRASLSEGSDTDEDGPR